MLVGLRSLGVCLPVLSGQQFIEEIEVNKNIYHPKVFSCQWIVPDPDQYKINLDVVIDQVGVRGAIEAICRDVNGDCIAACGRIIPHIIVHETPEATTCCEALALERLLH
jgi:hypothetical protein